ncbi:DUF134 domain-containing protein [Saccharicrinis sp. FJH62]|uniref:DUF134 domain-containing protein n=1 Tax=Saccharicrinis sp. FJH62 TaxID=3344657 RepID=UPI0035D4C9CA
MPRRRRLRNITAPPGFRGYKPYGCTRPNDSVNLNYEEYEAIKLADYDLMNHEEAALKMDVSRATFARIYESARRKIADALVNVKEIRTVFGNANLNDNWYSCKECFTRFTVPETLAEHNCPVCKSDQVLKINKENFSK